MRKIAVGRDDRGVNRLLLNGKPLFQFGPLDQGCWPDGLYTAPTDEALRYDIEMTEEARLQHDPQAREGRAGAVVLLSATSSACSSGRTCPAATTTTPDAESPTSTASSSAMIDALRNHPSIVMWVPFNEGWGQYETEKVRGVGEGARPDAAGEQRQRLDRSRRRRHHRHATPIPAPQARRPRDAARRCSASSAGSACRSTATPGSRRATGAIAASRRLQTSARRTAIC